LGDRSPSDIFDYSIQLGTALDINVSYVDKIKQRSTSHSYDWLNVSGDVFLDELFALRTLEERAALKKTYAPLLRKVSLGDQHYGRAALRLPNDLEDFYGSGFLSIEGVIYPTGRASRREYYDFYDNDPERYGIAISNRFIGVMAGTTEDVARSSSSPAIPTGAISTWLTEQASLVDPLAHETISLIPISHYILGSGGDPGKLAFCYSGGEFITADAAKERIAKLSKIHLLLGKNYKDGPEWVTVKDLNAIFFANKVKRDVFCSSFENKDLFEAEEGREIFNEAPTRLSDDQVERIKMTSGVIVLLKMLEDAWNSRLAYSIERIDIMERTLHIAVPARLVLTVVKNPAP
jgi:hypothetical protein